MKSALIAFVQGLGHDTEDCGPSSFSDGDDYPDYVLPAARKVANDQGSFGIVIGASGQGEAMAANRVAGVRAAVFYGDTFGAQEDADGNPLNLLQSVRAHNDANVLSIGARFVSEDAAKVAVRMFLGTEFSGDERHIRRIKKLDA